MKQATPAAAGESRPEFTTGALARSPTGDPEEGAASPTVGEPAEREEPDPNARQVAEEEVARIGEEDLAETPAESLFDPAVTARIVVLWILTPTLSVVGAYLLFSLLG